MTEPTTADFTSPIAGRIEVRDPCPWCGDRQMIPRSQMDEHCARLHPDVKTAVSSAGVVQLPPTNQAAVRDRIAAAVRTVPIKYGSDTIEPVSVEEADVIADAVLAVWPAPVDRAAALLNAADAVAALDPVEAALAGQGAWQDAAALLRRMAAEAPATEEQQDGAQS